MLSNVTTTQAFKADDGSIWKTRAEALNHNRKLFISKFESRHQIKPSIHYVPMACQYYSLENMILQHWDEFKELISKTP